MKTLIIALTFLSVMIAQVDAREFNFEQDMGPCAQPPYKGANCVTITYQYYLDTLQESKEMMEEQQAWLKQFAAEQKLGDIVLQYSSFTMQDKPGYRKEDGVYYRLRARETYMLENPEKARQFIKALKKKDYEATLLSDLMEGVQCATPE